MGCAVLTKILVICRFRQLLIVPRPPWLQPRKSHGPSIFPYYKIWMKAAKESTTWSCCSSVSSGQHWLQTGELNVAALSCSSAEKSAMRWSDRDASNSQPAPLQRYGTSNVLGKTTLPQGSNITFSCRTPRWVLLLDKTSALKIKTHSPVASRKNLLQMRLLVTDSLRGLNLTGSSENFRKSEIQKARIRRL